jgi:hypothetical protein
MRGRDLEETKTSLRLPRLDVEITHRRSPQGDGEQVLIGLRAAPSFAAFAEFLETVSPFQLWASLAGAAWMPWLWPPQTMLALWRFGGLAATRSSEDATAGTPPLEPPTRRD